MSPSSFRRPGGAATAAAAATCARVPPAARTLGVSPTPLPTTPSSRIINAGCSGGSTRWPKVQRCPGDIVKVRQQKKRKEKNGKGGRSGGRRSMWRTAKHAEPCLYHAHGNLEPSSSKKKTATFLILWGEVGPDSRLHYASVAVP